MVLFEIYYQMTQFVMTIMASDKASKKLSRGFPDSPILAMVIPKIMLKMTRPKVFVFIEYPLEISQSYNEETEIFHEFTNCLLFSNSNLTIFSYWIF